MAFDPGTPRIQDCDELSMDERQALQQLRADVANLNATVTALVTAFNAHTHQYNGAAAGNATSSTPDTTAQGQAPLAASIVGNPPPVVLQP